jgi:hypothetical protein
VQHAQAVAAHQYEKSRPGCKGRIGCRQVDAVDRSGNARNVDYRAQASQLLQADESPSQELKQHARNGYFDD